MHSIKTFALAFFSLLLYSNLNAQQAQSETQEEKLSLTNGSIDNQFEYVIQRSNNYQEFKVVKKTWLYELKAHTMDSIKAIQKNLDETQGIVETQSTEILDLKDKLSTTNNTLEATKQEKDNMSLFGLQMSKTNYKVIMWSVIGALLALLLVFIYKFRNSNAITKQSKKSLADIEEEFEEHRRTALEREQIVRRQLQDELNKQKKTK